MKSANRCAVAALLPARKPDPTARPANSMQNKRPHLVHAVAAPHRYSPILSPALRYSLGVALPASWLRPIQFRNLVLIQFPHPIAHLYISDLPRRARLCRLGARHPRCHPNTDPPPVKLNIILLLTSRYHQTLETTYSPGVPASPLSRGPATATPIPPHPEHFANFPLRAQVPAPPHFPLTTPCPRTL